MKRLPVIQLLEWYLCGLVPLHETVVGVRKDPSDWPEFLLEESLRASIPPGPWVQRGPK